MVDEKVETEKQRLDAVESNMARIDLLEKLHQQSQEIMTATSKLVTDNQKFAQETTDKNDQRLSHLESETSKLANRAVEASEKIAKESKEIEGLRRGLTGIENDQLPSVIQPILEQLNQAKTELLDIKQELRSMHPKHY